MSDATVAPMAAERSGYELLADPQLNTGTAFSEAERDAFHLHGWLPPHVSILDEQISAAVAVAMQAHREGATADVAVDQRLRAKVWTPRYVPLTLKGT